MSRDEQMGAGRKKNLLFYFFLFDESEDEGTIQKDQPPFSPTLKCPAPNWRLKTANPGIRGDH